MKALFIGILCCGAAILLMFQLILDARDQNPLGIKVTETSEYTYTVTLDATVTDAVRMTVVNNVIDSVIRVSTGFAGISVPLRRESHDCRFSQNTECSLQLNKTNSHNKPKRRTPMLKGSEVKNHFAQAKSVLVNFDEFLVQAMLAMLTREHVEWIGEPGVGKSFAARVIFGLFSPVSQMRIQLTKDMMPNHLIGNEIPKEYLESGREVYNLDGGITDVDLFFGDEFQDAPDFLLRALLTIMNERRFERKDMQVKCKLHSAILTTNFDRMSKAIEAVNDRIIFKSRIPSIDGITAEMEMYERYLNYSGEIPECQTIPFEQMKEVAAFIESPTGILIPRGVLMTASVLMDRYESAYRERAKKENLPAPDPISPRSKNKALDVLRAAAFLSDRTEVTYEDLRMLKYTLCILGNENLDEKVFTEVCDEVTPKSRAAEDRRDRLAGIAGAINELRHPANTLKEIALKIGATVRTYTRTEFEGVIQKLRAEAKGVEQEILTELEKSLAAVYKKPEVHTFEW